MLSVWLSFNTKRAILTCQIFPCATPAALWATLRKFSPNQILNWPWLSPISPARTELCGCSLWRTWSRWTGASRCLLGRLCERSHGGVSGLYGVRAARKALFLSPHTGLLFLWGHLFAGSDVTQANLALINQCFESDTSWVDRVCINDLLRTQTRKRRSCVGRTYHIQLKVCPRGLHKG